MKNKVFAKNIPQGLLEGAKTCWVNRISDFGNKSSRPRYPNIQKCSLYSEILDKKLSFHVTTSVLRNIDKMGGLDNYLLNTSDRKLNSDVATKWKFIIKHAQKNQNTSIEDTK